MKPVRFFLDLSIGFKGFSGSVKMRKMRLTLPFLLILLVGCQLIRSEEDEEDDEEKPKNCVQYSNNFLQSSVLTILKCLGEKFKPANIFEYTTRSYCIFKCVMTELGALTPEGTLDEINAAVFFEENFDTPVKDAILEPAQECFGLSAQFDPKDYWCKTYAPFISCIVKTLTKGILPYTANCFTSPIISIFFDTLKAFTPNPVPSETNELRRERAKSRQNSLKCVDLKCNRQYKVEKLNGTTIYVVYDKNMTEITRRKTTQRISTSSPIGFTSPVEHTP